jgi:DNA-binding NtrC family response regulator
MSAIHVLVVEDDLILNWASCNILLDSGFDVVGVHCAADAFAALERGSKLSALVTDIELGNGPDGFDVAHWVRTDNPHLPVVFISGTAWALQRAEQIERSEFIRKPFQPSEIVEALDRLGCRIVGQRQELDG